MFARIQIGGKTVPMLSVASCNIYYKRVFGSDPLRLQTKTDSDAADNLEFAMGMGFIFAKAAETNGDPSRMLTLCEEDYIAWLDTLGFPEYVGALNQVMALYNGGSVTSEKKDTSD